MLRKQVGSGKKRVMHRERIWTLHIVTVELFINQQSDINQCCEVQSPSYVCKAGAEKPEPRDHTLPESNPHPPQDASTLQGINAWTPSRENFPRLLCGFYYKYRNFLTAGFDPRSAAFSTFRAFCGYSEDFSEWAQQSYTVRTGKNQTSVSQYSADHTVSADRTVAISHFQYLHWETSTCCVVGQ